MVSPDLRSRYLDLLEKSLRNAIYGSRRWKCAAGQFFSVCGIRTPLVTARGVGPAPHTMLSAARLRHLRELVELTIQENIPGDYIRRAYGVAARAS